MDWQQTRLLISSFLYSRRPSWSLDRSIVLLIGKQSLPYWICSGIINEMSDDIGNVSGNAQMMFANQEPTSCGTETVGLVLKQSDLVKKRLCCCVVAADALLKMLGQMLVVAEIDAMIEE